MSPETFRAGYPRLSEFEAVRKKYGATGVLRLGAVDSDWS